MRGVRAAGRGPAKAGLLVCATLLAAGGLAGCGGNTDSSGTPSGTGYEAGSGNGGLLKSLKPAPTLAGTTLAGTPLTTASDQGKVLVINFYGSWCGPCRIETPLLVNAAAATSGKGVEFLGVDVLDSRTNADSFRTDLHVDYPSLFDANGTYLAKFKNVNPSAVPVTFVIDRQGKIAARWIGGISNAGQFTAILDKLAAQPA